MMKRRSRMISLVAMLALTLVICMLPAVLNSSARAEKAGWIRLRSFPRKTMAKS